MPAIQQRHTLPQHQNHLLGEQWQVSAQRGKRNTEDHANPACSEVSWSLWLDLTSRPAAAHIPVPSFPLPAAWDMMQAVPEGQGEGMSWPHLPHTSYSLLVIYSSRLPIQSGSNVTICIPITNSQPLIKSASTAAACVTTQPCLGDQRDPIVLPEMQEPDLPTVTEPNHPKVAGPPRFTSTTNPGLADGAGRAAAQAEAGTSTKHQPSPLINYSHCSHNQSPWQHRCLTPTTKTALS